MHLLPNCKFLKIRSHVWLICEFPCHLAESLPPNCAPQMFTDEGKAGGNFCPLCYAESRQPKTYVLSAEKQLSFYSPRERQKTISDSTTERRPCLKYKPRRFLKGPSAIRDCLKELCSSKKFPMGLDGEILPLWLMLPREPFSPPQLPTQTCRCSCASPTKMSKASCLSSRQARAGWLRKLCRGRQPVGFSFVSLSSVSPMKTPSITKMPGRRRQVILIPWEQHFESYN